MASNQYNALDTDNEPMKDGTSSIDTSIDIHKNKEINNSVEKSNMNIIFNGDKTIIFNLLSTNITALYSYGEFKQHILLSEFHIIKNTIKYFIAYALTDFKYYKHISPYNAVTHDMKLLNPMQNSFLPATIFYRFIDNVLILMKRRSWWISEKSNGQLIISMYLEKFLCTKLYKLLLSPLNQDKLNNFYIREKIKKLRPYLFSFNFNVISIEVSSQYTKAVQEICKINLYKSTYEKINIIINCMSYIVNAITEVKSVKNAGCVSIEEILPIFIMTVMDANPDNLLGNALFLDQYSTREIKNQQEGYLVTMFLSTAIFWFQCSHIELQLDKTLFNQLHNDILKVVTEESIRINSKENTENKNSQSDAFHNLKEYVYSL